MTLQQFKNLKINIPPYFVLDDTRSYENRFYISYHFESNKRLININFNKIFEKERIDVWISDLNLDENKRIKNIISKKISVDNLNKLINKIRFEDYFK